MNRFHTCNSLSCVVRRTLMWFRREVFSCFVLGVCVALLSVIVMIDPDAEAMAQDPLPATPVVASSAP